MRVLPGVMGTRERSVYGEPTKLAWKNERYFHRVEFLPGVCVCARACMCMCVYHSTSVEIRGQPAGTGSLPGIVLSSVAEAMPLPDGPHHQPCSWLLFSKAASHPFDSSARVQQWDAEAGSINTNTPGHLLGRWVPLAKLLFPFPHGIKR